MAISKPEFDFETQVMVTPIKHLVGDAVRYVLGGLLFNGLQIL